MPDYALVGDKRSGHLVVHRADCPEAGKASAKGLPVITMLDCKPLPSHMPYERHSCLPSRQREKV